MGVDRYLGRAGTAIKECFAVSAGSVGGQRSDSLSIRMLTACSYCGS